jgi:hypothetical protein
MKYLIDSDRVVDYLAGKQHAVSLLTSVWPDGIAISVSHFLKLGFLYHEHPC